MAASDSRSPEPAAASPAPAAPAPNRSAFPLAAVLIGLGVLLLALNLNLLRFDALLAALSLWPLALVALGIDLITRGRYRLPIWIAVAVLTALATFGWLGPFGSGSGPLGSVAVADATAVAVPRDGARSFELDLSSGLAELHLAALPAGGATLLEGSVATVRNQRLEQRVERDGARVRATLETRSDRVGFLGGIGRGGERSWQLAVAPDVPFELRLDSGVGLTDLDLRDLQLSGFEVNAGVGEVRIALPARGGYRGSIDAGVGEIGLRVPSSAAVRVDLDRGLGGLELRGFERVGEGYQTAAYATAPASDRADITIDGGLGSVDLRAE